MPIIFTNINVDGQEQAAILLDGAKYVLSSSRNPILTLEKSSNQTLTAIDTFNDIDWDVELVDSDGMHNPAFPELITITQTGRYFVSFQLCLQQVNNTIYTAQALKNGTLSSKQTTVESGTIAAIIEGSSIVELTKGDVYKLQWKANSVSDLLFAETKLDVIMLNPT